MDANIPDDLSDLAVEVDSLRPFPGNAREGDVGGICTSLEANSQFRPIVVNRREGGRYGGMTILAGNHTWQAAKALGWDLIAATFVDVDDATAKRINLVDNRSNDVASYDDVALVALLADIVGEQGPGGLVGTGFDGDDLDDLLADLERDGEGRAEPGEPQTCPSCGFELSSGSSR